MRHGKLCLFLPLVFLLYAGRIGHAETMYVSDHLYLSLRNAPDPEQSAVDLLPSDTKVDVLETQGKWARVNLEDGRTGWVMKRFLVLDLPKSLIIQQLQRQIENKNIVIERLREEIASLEKEIEGLKSQLTQQNERIELTIKEGDRKRLKGIYTTGIMTLCVGFIIGYLVRSPKRIGF